MILVAGATGNVGGALVRALTDEGEKVLALTRDPARAVLPAGATAVAGDLNDPAGLRPVLAGVRAVFLLSGYADMPGLLTEIRAAGAERVVLMSGSSAESTGPANPITDYMVTSERAVTESGLEHTILRPRTFMSNTTQWLPQLRAGDVVRGPWGGIPVATVDPADIAAVAARALLAADHSGAVYRVTGPEALTPGERVAVLADVLGRPLRFENQQDDEARAAMEKEMPAEYAAAFFSFFSGAHIDESTVYPTVEQVTGRPPRTYREWATANADRLR